MEIVINQILGGEDEKGGFGLLKHTLPDIREAKKLAFHSDIQDQANGVSWESTVRGLLVCDYYLIMKTFTDKSTDVRPGRVFSHVLVISKTDLKYIQNINPIFSLLPQSIDKVCSIEPILYDFAIDEPCQNSQQFQSRFNKAIHGYVNLKKYSNTIIWVGEENFELALACYWRILSIEEKEDLNFGLYFNADAIPKSKLNFISIQENIESRFVNKGFCLIRANDNYILKDVYEQLLGNDPKAKERISRFKELCEIDELSREAINIVGKVLDTFENIDSISDLKKLNTLSGVIAEYSPPKNNGSLFKEKLLNKICDLTSTCDTSELHIIRIFKTQSFADSERKLKQSIDKWLTSFLFSEQETQNRDFSLLFEKLTTTNPDNWWNLEINQKLEDFLSSINISKASVVYNWLKKDISILEYIEPLIDKTKDSETAFTSQLDKLSIKLTIYELLEFAVRRNWLKFHAKLMIRECTFEEALSKQLAVDKQENYFDGIKEIIQNVPYKEVIDFTLENGDRRLIEISGEYCHKEPSLLVDINPINVIWQEVWLQSIINGNNLSDGILDIQNKVYKLLDTIIAGKECNSKLLEKIGDSEYGNILYYTKRPSIWKCFPTNIKTKFLEKTSTVLLKTLSENTLTVIPDDKELGEFIIDHGISTFLYYNRNNLKATLPIFLTFSQLPEYIMKDYISNYYGSIDVVVATQLGKLTLQRNYKTVAHSIYQKSYSNFTFRIALNECYGLLNTADRFWAWAKNLVSNVTITENEWWETFSELSIKLYPNGPKQDKIWERAKGDESDLITHSTGKETWLAILKKLRNGGCNEITPKKLINTMLEDYKKNDELKILKDLLEKI